MATEKHERQFRGMWCPPEVVEMVFDKEISIKEAWLLLTIDSFVRLSGQDCYASNEYLAKCIQVQVRTVQTMLKHLRELGLLVETGFDGRRRMLRTAWSRAASRATDNMADVQKNAWQTCAQLRHIKNSNKEEIIQTPLSELKLTHFPTGEGESLVGKARRVHAHHCKVMSDNPEKPRSWKFEVYEKAYLRLLKVFTPEELMRASTNLSASRWHRGDNPQQKEYCDPHWLFGEKQAKMKVEKWLQEAGATEDAPASDEQYIRRHYMSLRGAHDQELTDADRDWMRAEDERRAKQLGISLLELVKREEEQRESRRRAEEDDEQW